MAKSARSVRVTSTPKAKSHGSRGSQSVHVHFSAVNNAAYSTPIPLVYGTNRIAPTVLWMGDWRAVTVNNTPAGTTGSSSASTGQTFYYVSFLLGLCEGPIGGVGQMWLNNGKQHFRPDYVARAFKMIPGSATDVAWSYLVTKHPEDALTYRFIGKLAASNYQAGTTQALPQFNIEVTGLLPFGQGIVDAEPSAIIVDLLSNPIHGAGFPLANIDTAGTFHQYAAANAAVGLFLSPIFDTQRSAAETLKLLLDITQAQLLWSDGLLKIVPFYDQVLSGNGATYIPQLSPVIPSSTTDDYVAAKASEPISMVRALPADNFNDVRVEIMSRAFGYVVEPGYAKSQADIEVFSRRPAQTVPYHPITTALTGMKVARMQLLRGLTVRNQYHFTLPQEYIWVDPLDIWPLTSAELGLLNYPVRILSIELDNKENLNVIAEDLGICNANGMVGGETHGAAQPPGIHAANLQNINDPVIFEMTSAMTYGRLFILFALSGQNANLNWGGATVQWSEDQVNWDVIGQARAPAKQGLLLSDLAAYTGAAPDNTHTLAVDLSGSGGTLVSTSVALAKAKHNLCVVCNADGTNFEYLSFTTVAAGAGDNQYNCTALYRGLYGTTASLHTAAASQFAFLNYVTALDAGIMRWEYPPRLIGETIYLQFLSWDPSNLFNQDPSTVVTYPYLVQGDGSTTQKTVDNVALTAEATLITLSGKPGVGSQQVYVSAFGSIQITGSATGASTSITLSDTLTSTIISSITLQLAPDGTYPFSIGGLAPITGKVDTYTLHFKPAGVGTKTVTATLALSLTSSNVVQLA